MAASHLAAASVAVALDRDAAAAKKNARIRKALDRLTDAARALADAAGADYLCVDIGTQPAIYAAADGHAAWSTHINHSDPRRPFGVAIRHAGDAMVEIFGPRLSVGPEIAPTADANPIVIRPLGLEV